MVLSLPYHTLYQHRAPAAGKKMSVVDEFLGFAGTLIGVVAMIPQIILTYNRQTVAGLSMVSIGLNALGTLFWLAYGIGNVNERWLVIMSSVVSLMQTAVLVYIYMNIRAGGHGRSEHTQSVSAECAPQILDFAPPRTSPASAGTSGGHASALHVRGPMQIASTDPVYIRVRL